MNIQAINTFSKVPPCQPIKPEYSKLSFARKKSIPEISTDMFENNDINNTEAKYDFACRLAAYYKTQYENLVKNGGVVV